MKKLAQNGMRLSVLAVAALPLSYLVRLILTKNLTLEEFGLFYAMIGFFGLLQSFNDLGFSEAQIYFIPKYLVQNRLDKVKATIKVQLINQLVTTFLIALILTFSARWFSQTFFHSVDVEPLFKLFIFYFVIKDFLQNVQILFFSHQEVTTHGSVEPLRFVLTTLLLGIALMLFKLDLMVVSWIWVSVYGILTLIYGVIFIYRHKKLLRASPYPVTSIYREFFPFLIPTLLSNNMGTLFSSATETLLVVIKGAADVGLYNIAKPILSLAIAVTSPLAQLFKPYISQINERNDDSQIRIILNLILNLGVFILLPFSLLLMFYSSESIVFLFGDQYIAASTTLKFISFEIFFNVMNSFVFGIVFGLGLQKERANVIYVSSILSLCLSLLFIPKFGAVGVALANIGYAAAALSGGLYIIHHKISFSFPLKSYLMYAGLGAILLLSQVVFKFISPTALGLQFILFIFKALIGLVLYFYLGIFVFKIIDKKLLVSMLLNSLPDKFKNRLSLGSS